MPGLLVRLRDGPIGRSHALGVWAMPLVVLCSVLVGLAIAGGVARSPDLLAQAKWAGFATLGALVLASLASGFGALPWMVPALLSWVIGVRGWQLLPLPGTPPYHAAAAAILVLPLMVMLVRRPMPAALGRAAAAAGAGFCVRLRQIYLPLLLPRALRGCLLCFLVSWGVMVGFAR